MSRRPTIKICGIRSYDMLEQMYGLSVDQIGFVFAPSKRQVQPEEVGRWIHRLKAEGYQQEGYFRTAGVFVNPDMEELQRILERAPLDIVQLHGQETPEFCRQVRERFGVAIFKAVSIPEEENGQTQESLAGIPELAEYVPYIEAFLMDTYDPAAGGGSGRTFSWERIPPVRDWARSAGRSLIIAGGLHPENVQHLLQTYGPDGVDVSSGVESGGIKDADKIKTFVKRVREA